MSKIQLEHTYFHVALAAFLSDFSLTVEPFRKLINATVPVTIMNTGDEAFMSSMLFKNPEDSKKLYQENPRLVFSIGAVNANFDELTSPYNLGRLNVQDPITEMKSDYHTNVRRVPLRVQMSYEAIMSNIDQYLKYVDVSLTVFNVSRVYEFFYMGSVYHGSYKLINDDYSSDTNFALGFDTDSRNRIMRSNVELQLQFPAFDVYDGASGDASHVSSIFGGADVMNKLIHSIYINGNENLALRYEVKTTD